MHGQFVWYELITPDPGAAQKFYSSVTGWGTQPFDNDYTMWTSAGSPFAGLYRLGPEMRQQGIPPHWMAYVESGDVDATARLATSLGGKVLSGPNDIPNVGRYAVLQDPQGASFGIYKTNGQSQGWDGTPVPGRMSWHELMTTDYSKAYDFYRKLFGWDKTGDMDMGGGNMYFMFGKGQQPYGGIFNRHGDMAGMHPFWLSYIYVSDVQKAFDKAVRAGAMVQRPPMEIPGGGTIAILGDPQGAAFALHSMKAMAASPAKPGAKKVATKSAAPSKGRPAAKKSRPKAKATKKRGAVKKSGASKKRGAGKKRPAALKRQPTKKGSGKKRSTAKKARRR
jgi:predicted enzyme related to lactoylglutathione lyase